MIPAILIVLYIAALVFAVQARSTSRRVYVVPGWFWRQALCIESYESGAQGSLARGATLWHIHTGNGYETGMQFKASTWRAAGGQTDRDGHFYYAPVSEIVYRAFRIWTMDNGSWREWPTTRRICGLA